MPIEAPGRSLSAYVSELVARLAEGDPPAFGRLRVIVAGQRGRIGLDDEAVEASFNAAGLEVVPAPSGQPLDGEGWTDRATVCAILDGTMEMTDAILSGHLQVRGAADSAFRFLTAVDILLDGAARIPALQHLARQFRAAGPSRSADSSEAPAPRVRFGPKEQRATEETLLHRLDLWSD
jgi:hypothetical protein